MSLFVYPATQVSLSGGATEAKQDTMITALDDINTELDGQSTLLTSIDGKDFATQTTLSALNTKVTAVDTGDVTVSSSALPTGAATSANQSTGNASLSSIDTEIQDLNARIPAGLVQEDHDNLSITYVTAGNGVGEIETVVYKLGVSTVATLTLAYDANDKLSTVTKS